MARGRAGATGYARRPRSPVTVRLASTSREYFARSFGAITQEKNGATIKLNKMTIGRRIGACSDKLGIERTIVAPIPNSTALTIMLNNSDIENLVDIGSRPPRHAMPVFGVRRNARLQKWFPSLRGDGNDTQVEGRRPRSRPSPPSCVSTQLWSSVHVCGVMRADPLFPTRILELRRQRAISGYCLCLQTQSPSPGLGEKYFSNFPVSSQ